MLGVAAQHDVGASACHIGGDRHGARASRLGNDIRLTLMVLGIQHIVLYSLCLEHSRENFGFFDRCGTDKDRLIFCAALLDEFDNGAEFCILIGKYTVRMINADHGLVSRHFHNVKPVDLAEFLFLRHCRTGHTGQLAIHTEVILNGYGSRDLHLRLNIDLFLCLERLVQSVLITSARHKSARERVNDNYFSVLYNIVNVSLFYAPCVNRLVDIMRYACVFWIVKVFYAEEFLDLFDTARSQHGAPVLFIDDIVEVFIVCFGF